MSAAVISAEAPTPDARLLAQEVAQRLDRVVARLPDLWRLLVRLHVQEEMPLDFLAPCLALPVDRLERELRSALASLRRQLGNEPWLGSEP